MDKVEKKKPRDAQLKLNVTLRIILGKMDEFLLYYRLFKAGFIN